MTRLAKLKLAQHVIHARPVVISIDDVLDAPRIHEPTVPDTWDDPTMDMLRTLTGRRTGQTMYATQCDCGQIIPVAPGRVTAPCAHVKPWLSIGAGVSLSKATPCVRPRPAFNTIEQALNMEQLLRDVFTW